MISKILAVGVVVLSGAGSELSENTIRLGLKGLGGILVLCLAVMLRRREAVPREVKLYLAFVAWVILSALVVADDPAQSVRGGLSLLQMAAFFWAVTTAHRWHPDLGVVMWGLWGVGIGFSLLSFLNPEAGAVLRGAGAGTARLSATGENPNYTGQVLLFAIFAALYLAQRSRSRLQTISALSGIPVFAFLLLYTGSRKMFVGAILLGLLWVVAFAWSRTGPMRGRRGRVLTSLVVAAAAWGTTAYWEGTPMARRSDLNDAALYRGGVEDRADLYKEGIAVFLEQPIAGVGLQNQAARIGNVAHSDYVDVLASTGIVGGSLYFSIYPIVFRRARGAARRFPNVLGVEWRTFLVYMALVFWLMFGFSRYNDLLHLLVFGSFSGLFLEYERTARVVGRRPVTSGHSASEVARAGSCPAHEGGWGCSEDAGHQWKREGAGSRAPGSLTRPLELHVSSERARRV